LSPRETEVEEASWLLTTQAVIERTDNILNAGFGGDLEHFRIAEEKIRPTAQLVADVTRERFPDLRIPPHARWRHFVVDGRDLWAELAATLDVPPEEQARIRFDLAITSVLLDAGAGPDWRYRHAPTGITVGRSEGLALASFEAFRSGLFSSDPARPLLADAAGLKGVSEAKLAEAFQAGENNPLTGIATRAELMRVLGASIEERLWGEAEELRPGALFDIVRRESESGTASIGAAIATMQSVVGAIWPGRQRLGGLNLGDTWHHPMAGGKGPGAGLVPFHKLMQWLCYSLIEPMQEAGLEVVEQEMLTPLAEYRNGGLLIDTGLLVPRHVKVLGEAHAPDDTVVVEWRALTVGLIRLVAEEVRDILDFTEQELPLASVLEGGTWWAGRRIAAEKRPGGPPPIRVISDGSVF